MPGYRMHIVGGIAAYGITLSILSLYSRYFHPSTPVLAEWLIFAVAGSLFPDIDTRSKGSSWFNKLIPILGVLCLVSRMYVLLGVLSIMWILPYLATHRGTFHRVWFVVLAPLGLAYFLGLHFPSYTRIFYYDAAFFITGALSHLWLDLGFKRMIRI